jgi:predicted peptidase
MAALLVALPGQDKRDRRKTPEPFGYFKLKPLASDDEKAMLDRVEKIKQIPAETFEAHEFQAANKVSLAYRLLKPKGYRPGIKYPLVVVFHGSGAIGSDNVQQLGIFARSWAQPELRDKYPCFVLAPQFPARSVEYVLPAAGAIPISKPLPPLYAAIELISAISKEFDVNKRRIYIMGFSMGGSSAMHAISLRPDMFAAAISIAGVPNPEMAAIIRRKSLWIMHGNNDRENAFEGDRIMYQALLRAGAKSVRFWEFEGVGHEAPARLFGADELPEWLFRQRNRG